MMTRIALLMAITLSSVTGCVADVGEDDDLIDPEVEAPELANQAFVAYAYNYTCGQTVSFRDGNYNLITQLPFHTKVWTTDNHPAYGTTWNLVRIESGPFKNQWGYALRAWMDQNC